MGIQITIYGSKQFNLAYNDDEIRSIINSHIHELKLRNAYYFTYYNLCQKILIKARDEGKIDGMEPNTYYESPQLTQREYTRISRLLWELIRKGEIFVDFSNNTYIAHYENDTTLGISDEQ